MLIQQSLHRRCGLSFMFSPDPLGNMSVSPSVKVLLVSFNCPCTSKMNSPSGRLPAAWLSYNVMDGYKLTTTDPESMQNKSLDRLNTHSSRAE